MKPAYVLFLKADKLLRLKRIDRKLVICDRNRTERNAALSSKWPCRPKEGKNLLRSTAQRAGNGRKSEICIKIRQLGCQRATV